MRLPRPLLLTIIALSSACVPIAPADGAVWQEVEAGRRATSPPEVAAIISGWRANRESFHFVRAKMHKVQAQAESEEHAMKGKYLPDPAPVRSERIWTTDGTATRFEQLFPDLGDEPRQGHRNRIEVRNLQFEINRSVGDRVHASSTWVSYVGKTTDPPWNPFAQGTWMCSSTEKDLAEFKGVHQIGERDLQAFRTSSASSKQINDFWVDPNRGFLPTRIEITFPPQDKPGIVTIYENFMQCENGGWVPQRWVTLIKPQAGSVLVDQHEVSEFSYDQSATAEMFNVSIPVGESFSFEPERVVSNRPVRWYRVLGGNFDLRWVQEDGSIVAPECAIELIPEPSRTPLSVPDLFTPGEERPTAWQLAIVLIMSVCGGFAILYLWRLLRRPKAGG
jgi:hypothetical protein